MRTAYFSPMAPSRSGIADYSALLVPALRERTGIEVVKQGSRKQPRGTDLARACRYLLEHDDDARAWGIAGRAIAETVTWDAVVDRLLS